MMEYMQTPAFIWIAAAVVLAIVEALTLGLTCIWFAGGAVCAAAVAAMGLGVPVQVGVFVIVSAILLIATRPLARKYLNGRITATNTDALIGQKAEVEEKIPAMGKGRVKLDGKLWSAQMADEDEAAEAEAGTLVEVTDIRGVTVLVKVIKED